MFKQTELVTNKRYFYKAWSVLSGISYSPGMIRSAVTLCENIAALPYTEGFETSSDRPGCWYEDNTDPAWQFIAGNGLGVIYGYPATAHSGEHNACLVDVSTAPDLNTLSTPVINLSGYTNVQLKFWMFMQKWGSRQDELKVYCRANPGLPWVLLKSFTQSISSWTEQSIMIPTGLNQIQIGFCGNARWGLGVCIDDIELSGTPLQTMIISPINRDVTMSAGEITFTITCPGAWTATSDAPSWCTVTPSGPGDGTITATYTENPLFSKRIATLTVSAPGVQTQTVTVKQNASNIAVNELSSGNIRIYPNPAKGFCKITDDQGKNQIREIMLVDFTGRIVLSRRGNGETEFEVDLSSLAPGTYAIKLLGQYGTVIRKLTIIR
ncbi:MAG: T9SS type A sorting domain-containing protein, partial [Bacteroidota bacterium]